MVPMWESPTSCVSVAQKPQTAGLLQFLELCSPQPNHNLRHELGPIHAGLGNWEAPDIEPSTSSTRLPEAP